MHYLNVREEECQDSLLFSSSGNNSAELVGTTPTHLSTHSRTAQLQNCTTAQLQNCSTVQLQNCCRPEQKTHHS